MNPSNSELIKVGNRLGNIYHYGLHRFFDSEGFGSRNATKKLIKRIDEIKPDVIHLHNIHDHWLNFPVFWNYLARIDVPVVWTFHDCWAFTGGCPYFDKYDCFKWQTGECKGVCIGEHKKSERNFAIKRELIGALGDRLTIVAVSQWMADFVNDSFIRDSGANIMVIHNGINLETFSPVATEKKSMVLGVASVWPKSKGLDDFIKLREILPDNINIVLVGLTKKQLEMLPAGIQGIARTNNIQELAKLYSEATVFVNPTRSDTFPTVNLEALGCGTPVITYRTGGSPEAVDESTGIVIEQGNVNALGEAILSVFTKKREFSIISCRKRAELEFDNKTQFNKYVKLYQNLIEN